MLPAPRLTHPSGIAAWLLALLAPGLAPAQEPAPGGPERAPVLDSIEAIDEQFNRELRELERSRLAHLAALAGQSEGEARSRALEVYFRSALEASLYEEAEALAEEVIGGAGGSPVVRYLASVANVMAEAERGAFEESLESIVGAVRASGADTPREEARLAELALPVAARLSLLDAYYQRLVQADQFDIALRAFRTIAQTNGEGDEPAVRDYLANRIRQLELVGRPAPDFAATTIDGEPIRLADYRGDVVLLHFWATWHRPNAEVVDWIEQSYESYRDRGLRVIGVNLDAMVEGSPSPESVLPEVRRYLIEHNIPWPNIIDVPGQVDLAQLFGVTEIPANVLIGRDGRVIHLDLTEGNIDRVLGEVLPE